VSKTSPVPEVLPAGSSASDYLDSWKEIAAYLNRHVRTLQRWERLGGLPVYRHPGSVGSVHAYKSELDAWRRQGQPRTQRKAPSPRSLRATEQRHPPTHLAEPGKVRLLVLPFQNLSSDVSQAFFSDGLTEEMITHLARLDPQKLGVIGRTTAMQYKDSKRRIDQIADELGVDYILEGSVRRDADRVRITSQLVRASDQTHLWAENYDRDLRDVLALQSDVAQSIAREIRLALPARVQARLSGLRSVNPEAYEAYLKGRALWYERTTEALKRSIEYFQQAIQKDENYAPAYAGLADAYGLLAIVPWDALAPREAMPKAKAMAQKALEIDDSLAEAYSSLALVLHRYEWDWPGAEQNYKRAIEMNPNSSRAHLWYAWLLMTMGRAEEGLSEIKEAEEVTRRIDPLGLVDIRATMAEGLFVARQYDRAIEECRKGFELNPNYFLLHYVLGRCYAQKRMYARAISLFERAIKFAGDNLLLLAALGYTYGFAGRRAKALKCFETLKGLRRSRYVSTIYFACIYAGLQDKDQTCLWLEKAYLERADGLNYINVEPGFDFLRSDPRFQKLLRRMNLKP
jgi:TolB-like protein/Tfp pilus assembly protein PilF